MTHPDNGQVAVLSRPHSVAQTPQEGVEVVLTATPAECAALAKLNNLAGVDRLTAKLIVERAGAGLLVRGALSADVRQICVVTLEPFPATIEEEIRLRFAPQAAAPAPSKHAAGKRAQDARAPGERAAGARAYDKHAPGKKSDRRRDLKALDDDVEPDLLIDIDDDPPDPLTGDNVDLGAVVAEFFALALDPYPRKPGAAFADAAEPQENAPVSAFAALGALRRNDDEV